MGVVPRPRRARRISQLASTELAAAARIVSASEHRGRFSSTQSVRYTSSQVMVRFLTLSRFVALALLLCIGQDLAGDLTCDQTAAAPARTGVASTSTDGDECQTVCVPDCFCCCRGVSSEVPPSLTVDGPVTTPPAPPAPLQPAGVAGSIFHPPLHRA